MGDLVERLRRLAPMLPGAREAALLREAADALQSRPAGWVSVETASLQPGCYYEAWHKIWKCVITVRLICGSETTSGSAEWREKTLSTTWPFEAFSHVRPIFTPPETAPVSTEEAE